MDSVLVPHANKQIGIKTPKKNRGGGFISNSNTSGSENFHAYAGLLNPPLLPPSRAMSLSYYDTKPLLSVSASVFNHQNGQNQNQQNQPPLLPLPPVSAIHHHHHHHQPLLSRSLSSNIQGRTRNTSLTAKKSKPTKREEVKKRSSGAQFLISASEKNRWGPDPKDLPKHHLPAVFTPNEGNMDMLSGSDFNLISPPPSSLPLPKFSLRSKLSCNAEAAAAGSVVDDDGATNNLRRLLRLM